MCVCTLCYKAVKKLSKESKGVLGQERTQEGALAREQEGKEGGRQASKQEPPQSKKK